MYNWLKEILINIPLKAVNTSLPLKNGKYKNIIDNINVILAVINEEDSLCYIFDQ